MDAKKILTAAADWSIFVLGIGCIAYPLILAHPSNSLYISTSSGSTAHIKGEIRANMKFRAPVDGGTLILDSVGGDVNNAIAIGTYVHTHRISTRVEGQCLSACAIIYSAGVYRSASVWSVIGVHATSIVDVDTGVPIHSVEAERQSIVKTMEVAKHMQEWGTPRDIIDRMETTTPPSITFVEPW